MNAIVYFQQKMCIYFIIIIVMNIISLSFLLLISKFSSNNLDETSFISGALFRICTTVSLKMSTKGVHHFLSCLQIKFNVFSSSKFTIMHHFSRKWGPVRNMRPKQMLHNSILILNILSTKHTNITQEARKRFTLRLTISFDDLSEASWYCLAFLEHLLSPIYRTKTAPK